MATKVKNTRKPANKTGTKKSTQKSKPATRKTASAKPRAKTTSTRSKGARKQPARGANSHLTHQQRLDAIGLALMACAAFFAFVFYFGWQGGKLGDGLASLMFSLIGQGAYLVPLALAVGGFVAILRPVLQRA